MSGAESLRVRKTAEAGPRTDQSASPSTSNPEPQSLPLKTFLQKPLGSLGSRSPGLAPHQEMATISPFGSLCQVDHLYSNGIHYHTTKSIASLLITDCTKTCKSFSYHVWNTIWWFESQHMWSIEQSPGKLHSTGKNMQILMWIYSLQCLTEFQYITPTATCFHQLNDSCLCRNINTFNKHKWEVSVGVSDGAMEKGTSAGPEGEGAMPWRQQMVVMTWGSHSEFWNPRGDWQDCSFSKWKVSSSWSLTGKLKILIVGKMLDQIFK